MTHFRHYRILSTHDGVRGYALSWTREVSMSGIARYWNAISWRMGRPSSNWRQRESNGHA